MNKEYVALGLITCISGLLLFVSVKKTQIRQAFFALLAAQLFSWPLTLLHVLFGFQKNPVRLFPYATEGNFTYSFIFHPIVFTIYYLHYPRQAGFVKRMLYSVIMAAFPVLIMLLGDLYTDLIQFSKKLVLLGTFFIFISVYTVLRKYTDWFFKYSYIPAEEE